MLQGNFYEVQSATSNGPAVTAVLSINAGHSIFSGHFPGQPVVPGVCMLQIVKELLENLIESNTRLRKADHLKFLAVINPVIHPVIQADLSYTNGEEGSFIVIARLYSGQLTFLKFRGLFVVG